MARVATVTGVLLLAVIHATMSVTVQDFFPDVKTNLTKIKWSHATNSQSELTKALESSDIMMIEADVVIIKNETTPEIPMMGHPPTNTSDLSLESFLTQVLANKKKGIKLDFKSIQAFTKGMEILQKIQNISVPIWLNADILPGPVNAGNETQAVDGAQFLKEAVKLPAALLSIGWTTRLEEGNQNATTGKYTGDQIKAMVKLIQDSKVNQSITYPVRACYAVNDVEVLKNLLEESKSNSPTLTIWSHKNDTVDATKLSELIKGIGVDKVFVDVPAELWQQLNIGNSAFAVKSSLGVMMASVLLGLVASKLL